MAIKPSAVVQGVPRPAAHGYEPRDVSVPWIFGIVLFLVCAGILIQLMLVGLLNHFKSRPAPGDGFRPNQKTVLSPSASFPRLQISPRLDLARFRSLEDEELTNYGWIDRTSGIVRIPIERAMELILQKGLPVRTNSDNPPGPSSADLIQQRSLHRQPEIPGDK
ncbi:MAG TPA: hypothetical protein VFE51_24725 [Verrucomicrobiae bacterium]|nr:hypothetical protein [Verrucomicrobiae bacterium]